MSLGSAVVQEMIITSLQPLMKYDELSRKISRNPLYALLSSYRKPAEIDGPHILVGLFSKSLLCYCQVKKSKKSMPALGKFIQS